MINREEGIGWVRFSDPESKRSALAYATWVVYPTASFDIGICVVQCCVDGKYDGDFRRTALFENAVGLAETYVKLGRTQ